MLRFKADRRTLIFVAAYFVTLGVLWFWAPASLVARGLLLACTFVLSFMGASATHNAVHSPLFKSRTMNRAFQVALTLTYGFPVSGFVPGHNLSHHRHMQTNRDSMRTTKMRFRNNLLNVLLFTPRVMKDILGGTSSDIAGMRKRTANWYRQIVLESRVFYGVSLILLIADWRKFLLYWMAPHLYAAWGIVTMNYLQHDGCDAESEWNHSRNFVGRIVNWFTYNNGYHTIHHMRPGLHWSLLPAAHEARVAAHMHPALAQRSLVGYCVRAYIAPGRRVTYDGRPVALPPPMSDASWLPSPDETLTEETLGAVLS